MIRTLPRWKLPLRFIEESRHIKLVVPPRLGAQPSSGRTLQLRPARSTPVVPRVPVRLTSTGEENDTPTQHVGAVYVGFHNRPSFTELPVPGDEHPPIAFEAKLVAEGIACVRSEEELEAIFVEIGVVERESMIITSLD